MLITIVSHLHADRKRFSFHVDYFRQPGELERRGTKRKLIIATIGSKKLEFYGNQMKFCPPSMERNMNVISWLFSAGRNTVAYFIYRE